MYYLSPDSQAEYVGEQFAGQKEARRQTEWTRGLEVVPGLVAEGRLEWLLLEDEDYRPQLPDPQGLLHSRVFPGLRVPVAPLLADDTANVLAALTKKEVPMGEHSENSVNRER